MSQTRLALFMQTQRELYLASLPAKVAEVGTALQQYLHAGDHAAGLSALAGAHKLAGSGGTFGFPAISEAATSIETLLSAATALGRPVGAAERQLLQVSAQALYDAMTQVSGTSAALSLPVPRVRSWAAPQLRTQTGGLIFIVEADMQAASRLSAQLQHAGYPSRIVEQPDQLPVQTRPVAILANAVFNADPQLKQYTQTVPEGADPVPVIFIAGGNDFEARLDAVRADAAGYFPHPLDVPVLVGLLDQVTSGEPVRPYRVLIVDDDDLLAAFYAGVLKASGMETCVVTDPSQVMAPLIDFQPDLITCDIHMPQCSGIELAALIRQQQAFVRIPIVFLSAETSLDKQAQALRQGGDDFIVKPVEPAALVSAAQSRARRYRSLLAAEDNLRISEERFRLVFETSLDGFIQALADGTVIAANPAACAMFGMDDARIKATGIAGLMDAADPRVKAMLQQQSHTGEFRGELNCIRGNGTRFPVEVSSSQHAGSNGDVQTSVILRDITERKLAEQQIMQLNTELESRVEQRTLELTVANQELQAFSQSLAHDLRQPYIAVNGLASLLEREMGAGASERGKHYLQRIRAGVNQMNERTDSLLALAQLSRTHIRRAPLDLAAMAEKEIETLRQQAPERQVHTQVQSPLSASADATLVRHLLKILLGNAWKFTSRQAHADISVGAESSAGGYTVYFVKDKGAGFDMAYADKLFGAFQRLHAPEDFPGAGIGLATARRIVTRHGGEIWAKSAPQEGACFYFTLGKQGR
ncbi:response regulator [Polaromonas sp.]|uniref:response regulator n=1 Tax=Polaromonas sp. TaxID=1869339 RepID=UPI0037532D9E